MLITFHFFHIGVAAGMTRTKLASVRLLRCEKCENDNVRIATAVGNSTADIKPIRLAPVESQTIESPMSTGLIMTTSLLNNLWTSRTLRPGMMITKPNVEKCATSRTRPFRSAHRTITVQSVFCKYHIICNEPRLSTGEFFIKPSFGATFDQRIFGVHILSRQLGCFPAIAVLSWAILSCYDSSWITISRLGSSITLKYTCSGLRSSASAYLLIKTKLE
jgi:hypothetical protein